MSGIDADIANKVRQWLALGDEDLRLARHALTLGAETPYRLVAYHAQQCAEKWLKASLVFHGLDFPYTHNMARLLELCAQDGNWAETLTDAEELTPYAITTRYPGTDEDVSEREALRAIEIAAHVREVVTAALVREGADIPGL
jgi:HEPN domain-containing protein